MVYILLADGFEEIEALAPVDLLRRARIDVTLVGVSGETVTGSRGIAVQADCGLDGIDREALEMLVLPGGGAGVNVLEAAPGVRELVTFTAANHKLLAAICAAPVLLAKWGLLTGKRAVCYPGCRDELVSYGAKLWRDDDVTHDGHIITGAAAGSAIPFALKLITFLRGWEASETVRRSIYWHYGKSLT